MLLQRRAIKKYHSGGLWTNACCSHPAPGEELGIAAMRRLKEEMGFETPIEKVFDFIYKAAFENGLTEYEFDHVFAGQYDGMIFPDKEEAMDYCYKSVPEISQSLLNQPHLYSAWFKAAFPRIESWWMNRYKNMVA
jgi:isopentenyl-diphosphate delta-isomerase